MNERSLGGGSEQMCLTFPGVEYFLTTVRTFRFRSIFQRAFKLLDALASLDLKLSVGQSVSE